MHNEVVWAGHQWWLLPEKAVFWPKHSMLIIADAHLGKSAHFLKNGIYLPSAPFETELGIIKQLLCTYAPKIMLFLGDMFHSTFNESCNRYAELLQNFEHTKSVLVKGNHDVFKPVQYHKLAIEVVNEWQQENILFIHHSANENATKPVVQGHIHPVYKFKGKAHQQIKLPVFHFSENVFTLPAFSLYAGGYAIKTQKNDKLFAIANDEVIDITVNGIIMR